jgi:hypothetical protein
MDAMGSPRRFTLARTRTRARLVQRLGTRLRRVGLQGVLADLDRLGARVPVPGDAAGDGFTWDDADAEDPTWWPQGVASLGSGDVLLVSWYAKRNRWFRTPGCRISVVDRAHPDGPRYRHVRLVVPRRRLGFLALGAVPVHAGGIAVHGDFLLVADTLLGIRVFRLADVMTVPSGWSRWWRTAADDGDFVLPQVTTFRVPYLAGRNRLRFSFLSIGEVDGRPNLVVGEYRRAADRPPRLVRYLVDARTGLPALGARGRAVPLAVHEDQPRRMQGVAVHGADWFVTASAGRGICGDLHVGRPGTWRRHRGVLPPGPEDLDWSRPGEELWSVTEWPGHRWVFPVATHPWRADAPGPVTS